MRELKIFTLIALTIVALGFSGCGSSSSDDSSTTTTTTELYIKSAIYNNKLTTNVDDDILTITFNKNIKESLLKSDISLNYEIDGTGKIGSDSKGDYNSETFTHTISLGSSSTAFSIGDTIKIAKNSITDIDGSYPKEFNKVKIMWFTPVIKTGQTTKYVDFDDGYYQKGATRSYKRDNGIVTDNVTGLKWQDDYSDNGGAIKKANWSGATTYCNNLSLGELKWRLPTIKELLMIVDNNKSNPSIDSIFKNIISDEHYLSSSTDASETKSAWSVSFSSGFTNNTYKSRSYYVRCVRDRQ